jgi:hypothetical protein
MTKSKRSKLALKNETIRALTTIEREAVVAGRDPEISRERPCYPTLGPGQACY